MDVSTAVWFKVATIMIEKTLLFRSILFFHVQKKSNKKLKIKKKWSRIPPRPRRDSGCN